MYVAYISAYTQGKSSRNAIYIYIYICGGYLGAHLIFKDESARRQANNLQTCRKPTKNQQGIYRNLITVSFVCL